MKRSIHEMLIDHDFEVRQYIDEHDELLNEFEELAPPEYSRIEKVIYILRIFAASYAEMADEAGQDDAKAKLLEIKRHLDEIQEKVKNEKQAECN